MPLWSSPQRDYSEHAPLSTHDDDDEEVPALPLSSYSAATPSRSSYSDNPENGNYDDEDPGFGEGDFYHNGIGGGGRNINPYSSNQQQRLPHNNYRTGLICAYLKHFLTCCGSTRLKRCFLCLFYMVLMITIMVCAASVGYIIARDGNYQNNNEQGNVNVGNTNNDAVVAVDTNRGGGTPTTTTVNKQKPQIINTAATKQKLPHPPLNLHEICSDWITESGRQKCQSECNKADCCSLPLSNKNSCWEEQAEDCATYRAACMALELHSDDDTQTTGSGSGSGVIGSKTILYAPPSNLSVLCSTTALATPGGFDNCANVCRPSRCCFPDQFDCNLADDRYCEDYEDLCASVAESWRGSGHAVATTLSSTTSSSSVTSTTTSSRAPTIANEVMKACNAANLNPPDDCIEACKPGACCYVSSSYLPIEQLFDQFYGASNNPMQSVSSCASSVGFCQQYGSCEHLNHMKDVAGWNSEEVNYVVDVSTPCKAEHIAQFGALQCSNVCQPAHCCFSGEYACDDVQLGHLKCEDYSDCQVLYPTKKVSTEELLEVAKHIDKACSASSLKTIGGRAECQDICSDHSCCFDENGCMDDPDQNCVAYAGCEPFYNVPTKFAGGTASNSDVGGSDGNNVSSSTPEMIEKNVYDACYFNDDESRVTQELVTNCHNVCQSRYCCFDSYKLESSCRAAVGENECELFALCEQMITADGGVVKNFVELDLQEFKDDDFDNTSTSQEMIEKDVYDACYFDTDESRVTQDLVTKCNNVCQHRYCCFDGYKLESSCRATVGEDECELFALCEQMITADGGLVKNFIELDLQEFNDDGASNSNSASGSGSIVQYPSGNTGADNGNGADTFASQLENACSESSLKTLDGLQTCHSKCQAHLCCFTTDPRLADQNCSGLIPSGCSAYEPCKRLVTPPTDTYPVASPAALSTREEIEKRVYDACYFGDDPTKVTEELVTKCHGVCAQRLCCFSDYSDYSLQSSCRATIGDDECELYSLCDQLVTENGVASDALEVEEKEFGVNELCIDKAAVDTTLFSACKETCQRRSCCFESNPGYSCYEIEKAWCDEYKACEVIGLNFQGQR